MDRAARTRANGFRLLTGTPPCRVRAAQWPTAEREVANASDRSGAHPANRLPVATITEMAANTTTAPGQPVFFVGAGGL